MSEGQPSIVSLIPHRGPSLLLEAVLELSPGALLEVDLTDAYWVKLLMPGYVYEPEVGPMLRRVLVEHQPDFIDCGANIGYWSVLASAWTDGAVSAVEASAGSFERLVMNAWLNKSRFRCIHAAVWSTDGESLLIETDRELGHSAAAVSAPGSSGTSAKHHESVTSASLDALCGLPTLDPERGLVIKLDVEGSEIAALHGAERTLHERDPLIVYEDHGADPSCRTSAFVLEELGYSVYYCALAGSPVRLPDVDSVERVKKLASRGYNFFACSSASRFASMLEARVDS